MPRRGRPGIPHSSSGDRLEGLLRELNPGPLGTTENHATRPSSRESIFEVVRLSHVSKFQGLQQAAAGAVRARGGNRPTGEVRGRGNPTAQPRCSPPPRKRKHPGSIPGAPPRKLLLLLLLSLLLLLLLLLVGASMAGANGRSVETGHGKTKWQDGGGRLQGADGRTACHLQTADRRTAVSPADG